MVVFIHKYLEDYYGMIDCSIEKCQEGYTILFHHNTYLFFYILSYEDIFQYFHFSNIVHYSYSFIPNKKGEYVNLIEDQSYVLLKINFYPISYSDIINPYIIETILSIRWRDKWIQKSEILQSMYYEIRGKYLIVDESIPYYSSLLDYAIYLLKDFSSYTDYGFIQHTFLNDDTFCNPFYFMIDLKERDIAGYLKYLFYHNEYYCDYFWKKLSSQSFNFTLLLARLIYPDWYLLEFERIVYDHKEVDDLKMVVSKTYKYIDMIHDFMSFCGIKKVSL